MTELKISKKTIFVEHCLNLEIDTEALDSLYTFIQGTDEVDGFDVALKRLHAILPHIQSFAPEINDTIIHSWLHCVNQLLPEIDKDWFKSNSTNFVPQKQNSKKRLGDRYEGQNFYTMKIPRSMVFQVPRKSLPVRC